MVQGPADESMAGIETAMNTWIRGERDLAALAYQRAHNTEQGKTKEGGPEDKSRPRGIE